MPLANYTTTVAAEKSAGEIQGMLAGHKVRRMLFGYSGDGLLESLSFTIATPKGEIPFRLPANVAKVREILIGMRARKPKSWQSDYAQVMKKMDDQAYRIGWRNIRDWVRAQLAFVETEMVTLQQVFLPYMTVSEDKTLYEALEERGFGFKQLMQGKGDTRE